MEWKQIYSIGRDQQVGGQSGKEGMMDSYGRGGDTRQMVCVMSQGWRSRNSGMYWKG